MSKKTKGVDNCRHCNSINLILNKWIYTNHSNGNNEYHYKAKCKDCKKQYHLPRNKYVFEKVKNLDWQYSKKSIELGKNIK